MPLIKTGLGKKLWTIDLDLRRRRNFRKLSLKSPKKLSHLFNCISLEKLSVFKLVNQRIIYHDANTLYIAILF